MRAALAALPDVRLAVIAPDGNRSAMARSITTRRPLWVEEVELSRRQPWGMPPTAPPWTACASPASASWRASTPTWSSPASTTAPTSATTSPTRAPSPRRWRASCWGCPRSRSPSSPARAPWTTASTAASTSTSPPASSRAWSSAWSRCRCPRHPAQRQRPRRAPGRRGGGAPGQAHLPRRAQAGARGGGPPARRRYWIYGDDPGFHDEPGTDLAAVAAGRIAVTPMHFDLTYLPGIEALGGFDLDGLLDAAEVEAG